MSEPQQQELEYDRYNPGRAEFKPITKGGCMSVTNGLRAFCLWAIRVAKR
ncbi:hypothetical protein LCGC14_0455660 [marine sediment metagenome]|uniref:Uncharacterized protein n=1 Tax=marine sediment metagenome TaxID=412755 RepID=A0A0F9SGJ3_9ZZZZ